MTIEEIKTSVTMALVKAVTVENEKTTLHIQDDVVKQCDIVNILSESCTNYIKFFK